MKTNNYCRRTRRMGLLILVLFAATLPVLGHNLDQRDVSIVYDQYHLARMAQRAGLGQPMNQVGDEVWVILKSTPGPGTLTGVGGYLTFYVPSGSVEVLEAVYLTPTPGTSNSVHAPANFTPVPMKGQSIIAVGSGPIGPASTPALIGLSLTNTFGQGEATVTGTGVHRGTIAGVYADTGIFFSEDPRTAWQSWADAPPTGPLSRRGYPVSMVNNRGETITPITRYDAEQLIAYGRSDSAPVVDPNGRGSTPWGLGNVVSGPLSGYAWNFDLNTWVDTGNMKAAVTNVGPWQRIQYPGSQYSKDQAGLISSALGYAGQNCHDVGYDLGTHPGESPLPSTANAVRFSYGLLELGRSEYAAVKVKILIPPPNDCLDMNTDAFGGDAGGEQGGKDHEWRYYDPTTANLSGCVTLSKVASQPLLKVGETFYFTITFANSGLVALTNVVLTDTIQSGFTFLSSVPAQNSGPNPLKWDLGTVESNGIRQITVNVRANTIGVHSNEVVATSVSNIIAKAQETVEVSNKALLRPLKTVSPSNCVPPGSTVTYKIYVLNEGTGPNGVPLKVTDVLPPGFTYGQLLSAQLNGAALPTNAVTVTTTTNGPAFSISQSIQDHQMLVLEFTAHVSPTQPLGTNYNTVVLSFENKIVSGAPTAPVVICGGKIGDTVFRDWNGNGTQDPGEEGMPGVTVTLLLDADNNGSYETTLDTQVTDATGYYLFSGLLDGKYQVVVPAPGSGGVPSSYTLTADPDGGSATTTHDKTLAANEVYLVADWGYQPGGPGAIGDTVYNDVNGNKVQDGGESGITNVTVYLYEDTNGNGLLEGGDLLIATTSTAGSGLYQFTGLATNISYLVDADEADPDLAAFFSPNSFLATTPALQAVPLLSGTYSDADFGYIANLPSSIGDTVFIDKDGDGIYTNTVDIPLPNITVTLYRDSNADGAADGPAIATQSTDGLGQYLFSPLPPDTYLVVVDTADPDLPGGLAAWVDQYIVPLPVSTAYLTADFPFAPLITKSVDKGFALPGEVVTYSIRTDYAGKELLTGARVIDPFPTGVTFSNATAGGVYGAYVPYTAENGEDIGEPGEPSTTNSLAVSANAAAVGSKVVVTMTLRSSVTMTNVVPSLTAVGGTATLEGPFGGTFPTTVTAGVARVVTFTNTVTSLGEIRFEGSASGVNSTDGSDYEFPGALSASVLVSLNGTTSVVTWMVGTNAVGQPGVTTAGGRLPSVYALKGDKKTTFWKYVIASNLWTVAPSAPANIGVGGAMVLAGADTLYALRGDKQKSFYRFTPSSGTWASMANTPANVGKGGALTYVPGVTNYLYAFRGDTQPGFWRYDVGANTWTAMSNTPFNIKEGGALTTDGTNIFALFGNGGAGAARRRFYRYNVASDTWTALLSIPGDTGKGAGLVRIGGFIYATIGNDKTSFYRYTIASNSWASLAATPGTVKQGGSLTTDGSLIYATRGDNTTAFWSYNPANNTWTTLANTLANMGSDADGGGALAYEPGNPTGLREVVLEAQRTMVNSGTVVEVQMRVRSAVDETLVAPTLLTVTTNNGASATLQSGPTPATVAMASNVWKVFSWQYLVRSGTNIGSVTFTGGATNSLGASFGTAVSQSVLVMPALSFRVGVNSPLTVNVISNQAIVADASGAIPATPSEIVLTATSATIGDRVWLDSNGDGVQDVGEPGIPDVTIWLYGDPNNNGIVDPGEVRVSTNVTDAAGIYRFYNVIPGTNYVVTYDYATVPAGYLPTTDNDPDSGKVQHDVGTITPGLQYDLADFGLEPPGEASIGDTVWLDANSNGIREGGETGLTNIAVWLYFDDSGNGVLDPGDFLLQALATDTNGLYTFPGLTTNAYLVAVDGSSPVPNPYGGSSALTNAMSLVSGTNPHAVTLTTANEAYVNADFGYNWTGVIGDYVWWDDNRNQLQDEPGSRGISNVVVMLYTDNNTNGVFDPANGDTQYGPVRFTSGSGVYLFTNLPPGTYFVDVYEDSIGLDGPVATTPNVVKILLSAGQTNLTADFGYYIGAKVEGNVFWDADRNTLFDGGENGLTNVTVYLTGTDMFGAPVVMTNQTDASGHYSFVVPEGDYTLTYSTPTLLANYPALTDPTTVMSFSFHASPGESWVHEPFDFGVDNNGRIGDFIFADVNSNAVHDVGEPGLAGVTVVLYRDNNNDNQVDAGDTFLETKVTDASGQYLFLGLADGNYVVEVNTGTLPTGHQTTPSARPPTEWVSGSQAGATISGGNQVLDRDFGYPPVPAPSFSLSGTVYYDANTNGSLGAGESGLTNVTVTVGVDTNNDGTNDVVYTVFTDLSGFYSVSGIPSNSTVTVTVNEGTLPNPAYVLTGDPNGAPLSNVWTVPNINANQTDIDFGYFADYGSIRGTVVTDADGDGLAEGGETPVLGVLITLKYAGPDGILGTGDDVTMTTTTDINGDYLFGNLLPGQYEVVKTNPAGYLDLADADAGNTSSISVTLAIGQDVVDRDFELQRFGTIGDRVWLDENGNGLQDAGEDGIPNTTVELVGAGGLVVASTVTDLEGGYFFKGLAEGIYTVRVVQASLPAGLAANPTYDEDGIGTMHQSVVTLAEGAIHRTADFGYNWASPPDTDNGTGTGAIGDRVWIDANGNGAQDPGEAGLGGVTVDLYVDADTNGTYETVFTTTVTAADGRYIFDDLPAGGYQVVVNGGTTPAGYAQTGDPDDFGTLAGSPDNRTTTPVILAPGDVFVNADFGYQPTAGTFGSIGDRVWLDLNTNGVQDASEPGLPGVTVALVRDSNGNNRWDAGEPVIATTVTGTNGLYSFAGLPVADGVGTDDYLVWVNDTAGLLAKLSPTFDFDGASPASGLKTGYGISAAGDLTPAGTVLQDFGYSPADSTPGDGKLGAIGDTVFLDRNDNGSFNPGEGLEGVSVRLYLDNGSVPGMPDLNDTLVTTVQTDPNGYYYFSGLATNQYVVQILTSTLPAGVTNSVDPDGGLPHSSALTLTEGEVNLMQDFGYILPNDITNLIGGTVWKDRNADGTLNESGGGVPGVTVVLRNSNGNVVAQTMTDASGGYFFSYVPSGTYTVDVTDEANRLAGWWHSDGPNDGADNNSQPDPYTVTVTGGQINLTGDFGYYVDPAALGNRVWLDLGPTPNGRQDAGEVGISNVLVRLTLTYANGVTNVVAIRTGANGFYSFGNLLLDEDLDGAGLGEPIFILTPVCPTNLNHTVHDQPGVPDSLDSDLGSGALATTLKGVNAVAANADPTLEVPQGWYDFGFTPIPTLAVITAVRCRVENGVAIVSWDVDVELDTAGYYLERWVNGAWVRVHTDLIPAQLFVPGTKTYEQTDPGAPLGTTQRYQIVELENSGRLIPYGPYDLLLDGGEVSYETWATGIAWGGRDPSRTADPDGDGLTNFQEYVAGTDPLSENSVLRVDRVDAVGGGLRLSWSSEPGRTYAVEMALTLTGPYLAVATDLAATPPENQFVVPVSSEANAYFRVLVIEP